MPVEIKELIVKTTVEGDSGKPSVDMLAKMLNEIKDQIIEECVEHIQNGTRNSNER